MGYSISGQLVDSSNKPIEFATIYTSDSSGKPLIGSKNTQSDEKGRWSLNGVEDSDYITITMVGYNKNIFPAKSVVPVDISGVGMPIRIIKKTLKEDVQTMLADVPIVSKRVIYKEKKTGKYIAIASLGLLLISASVILLNKNLS